MSGLEEVGDAVIGVVVDQNRAQERLFRIDVARRDAVLRLDGFKAGYQGIGGHSGLQSRFWLGLLYGSQTKKVLKRALSELPTRVHTRNPEHA
jgi:hypothetical protein